VPKLRCVKKIGTVGGFIIDRFVRAHRGHLSTKPALLAFTISIRIARPFL
jgi:hypothetical protein